MKKVCYVSANQFRLNMKFPLSSLTINIALKIALTHYFILATERQL